MYATVAISLVMSLFLSIGMIVGWALASGLILFQ